MGQSERLRLRLLLASALALTTAGAFAGQVKLFEHQSFQGRAGTTTGEVPNLPASSFGDTASSIVVNEGTWEACTEINFHGRCAELVAGSYATLSRALNGRFSSVREIASLPVPARVVVAPDRPLATVSSQGPVVVNPGTTTYIVVNPSAAAVAVSPATAAIVISPDPRQVVVAAPNVAYAPVPSGRLVLYQYPNFGGPAAVVEHGRTPDLDWANFQYAASSLRVESGTWLVCSEIGYQGQCRIVGQGEYPVLAGVLDQGIYSARQVWRPDVGAAAVTPLYHDHGQ